MRWWRGWEGRRGEELAGGSAKENVGESFGFVVTPASFSFLVACALWPPHPVATHTRTLHTRNPHTTMSQPGFQFDLCARNAALEARGVVAPRLKKTGTTIAGLLFDVSLV